jgi:hypothetical protein
MYLEMAQIDVPLLPKIEIINSSGVDAKKRRLQEVDKRTGSHSHLNKVLYKNK